MALHHELQRMLVSINAVEADATSLTAQLTDAQANWRPDGGAGWSVAQCLEHLTKINYFYVAPFLEAAERAKAQGRGPYRGVQLTWAAQRWVRALKPPVTVRMKAPAVVQPPATVSLSVVRDNYVKSHLPYRRLLEVANDIDVNRVRAQNPFVRLIPTRVSTALVVVIAHDRRHLWQAHRVVAAADFPR